MQKLFLDEILNSFCRIILHRVVYNELDNDTKQLINGYIGKNVIIVDDSKLLNIDPRYTQLFNEIQNSELLYNFSIQRKNQGEIHSLAYAAFYSIPFFSSRDQDACDTCDELDILKDVNVLGFEELLAFSYLETSNSEIHKGQKALYKEFCSLKIKQKKIPETLREYINHEILSD